MPRFHAVLFDFDGTLADSYAAITASVNHVLDHFARPELTESQVRSLVGHGLEQLMETILPDIDPKLSARIYRDHHPSVMGRLTKLLPGVAEGLIKLRENGIRMGICSNKPTFFTRKLVDQLEINSYFGAIYGPDTVGAPKPNPIMLTKAIHQLDAQPANSLYVGDMIVDIETGRAAGVETWVMPTGSNDKATLEAASADRVFDDMSEVVGAILA
jgi:2-phosphoglycolate phosphatase